MRIFAIGVLVAFAASACGSPTAAPATEAKADLAAAPDVEAQIDDDCPVLAGIGPRLAAVDNWFGPDCLQVRSDATLYVYNLGDYKHSFTISAETFGEKPFLVDVQLPGGDKKARPVELSDVELSPGTYEYFCTYHGSMDGVLEIIEPVV